ncbi:hypothetical protein [Butyrivibrio sp. AE2032]|uniref:hypothetical protein n=1 Tax=Butyrivibrio sp. AE2032 TaxID=1458463 RepID=UPI0005551BBE|nr:hypothetical protein [Butyrivibrio sp. AE2032]
MKNKGLALCLAVLLMLSGCSNGEASVRTAGQTAGVKDVLESGIAEEDGKTSGSGSAADDSGNGLQNGANDGTTASDTGSAAPADPANGIDVDLTVLSSNMVYAEVFNMVYSPEEYIGKTIKMKGQFSLLQDEATGNLYYACIIADATACCSQGIEFIPANGAVYPDDFPEIGTEICVAGEFTTYQEGGTTYCTLANARFMQI